MLLSIAELMFAVLRLTSRFAFFMRRRCESVNHRHSGSTSASARASRHCSVKSTASAPTIVSVQITTFSGPWWLSSVTSKRSEVMRLISTPVRFLS